MKNLIVAGLLMPVLFCFCTNPKSESFDVNQSLDYCNDQVNKTLTEIGDTNMLPTNILDSVKHWKMVEIRAWTSGFWPGILWYDYEHTKNEEIKAHAIHYTEILEPLSRSRATDHDLGFKVFCSFGNAYRLTGNEAYKEVIIRTADTLATLYNPVVGTLLSWPGMVKKMDWPHNTIVDNLMNLEMLFWASKNGGSKDLYDIALSHAKVTMQNHFREDGSSYHVAVYDTISGKFIKGVTHQGYADNTMWARGQAWGIYGYTMIYRETGDKTFLRFAEKITDVFLKRLPEDRVPYWDFDAPGIPNEPKDASASAIVASALLELSQLEDNAELGKKYKQTAIKILESLSSANYQSRDTKPSFLLHSTGHKPNGGEVDAAIIYADYYYIEALTRLAKLQSASGTKSDEN